MKHEWEIKSRSHTCSYTGKEFQKGENFYTLLYREAGGGFRREDICEEAWAIKGASHSEKEASNDQPFSFWKSRYEPPAPPPPESVAKKDGESALRRLIAENNPAHTNLIYILALLLERKRLLRPMEGEDQNTLIYEYPSTGEVFLIRNPHLSLDQIPAVQREVSELLTQNL